MSFQSLFTDEPDKQWVSGLGYEGGSWRIKPTSFQEDDADQRFPAFQKAWRDGAPNDRMFGDEPFKLHGSVGGSGVDNHRPDVAKVESFLTDTGYYKPLTEDGPSGYHNGNLDKAIRRFQQDNGLAVDGVLKPGGPTIAKLKDAVGVGDGSSALAAKPTSPGAPMLFAQSSSDSQTDASLVAPADQQLAQAGPVAARMMVQWGIPAAIAAGQAARNLLEEWQKKPTDLPPPEPSPPVSPPQPVDVPTRLENPVLEDTLREAMSRPLENSRGDPTTQRGNDIAIDECLKVMKAEFPALGDHIQHRGGGTQDGKGKETVQEEVINGPGGKWLGGSRPDITLQHGNDPKERYRINTTTMRGERMTSREQASFDNLIRNLGNDLASWMPKFRPGMDEDEYRAKAREVCRKAAEKWSDHLSQKGKIPAQGRTPQGME
ncbi:MAG TPA: peptidoglycan-binding domain-containing protein [Magnetospirillum sp.]|nr:peptidoglycan-binding domain-containing protein [Magnetospirillum sp.]